MATFIGTDKELLCPICVGRYNVPRKLPGCVHAFCEKCILDLILNQKKEDKLGAEFDCPVCRLPSKSPDEDNITIEWVQKMENHTELEAKLGMQKDNTCNTEWCSQCRYLDKFNKSKLYCATCQVCFCESCSETLHSFMMHRGHVLLDIKPKGNCEKESVHEQAIQLLQKFFRCQDHPKKCVEFYCQNEEQFCCMFCAAAKHQHCVNVKHLQEISEIDSGKEQDDGNSEKLLKSLTKLSEHIQAIIGLVKIQDAEIKKVPDKLAVEFQDMKQKVIRLLDSIEENIMQESRSVSKAISIKNMDAIQELNNIASEVNVVMYLTRNLIGKIPHENGLVCYSEARKEMLMLERKVLERGPVLETVKLELKTENVFDEIVKIGPNETTRIASIAKNAKSYPLPRYNERFLLRAGKIENIGAKNCIAADSPGNPKYNGLLFVSDNRLILTDSYYGKCCLIDENSDYVDCMDFAVNEVTKESFTDTNFIYPSLLVSGLIAVSVRAKKKICFLAAREGLVMKGEIICKYNPNAIQGLRNGDIAVLWGNPSAFGIVSLVGGSYCDRIYFTVDKEGKKVNSVRIMAVDEDRSHVVLSSKWNNSITCYDFDANRMFEYKNTDIKDPRGMAIDRQGNIYVCEQRHGKIYVLSAEGFLVRLIHEECPAHPLAIGFNEDGNKFAVTQTNPKSQQISFFSLGPNDN